MPTSHNGTKQHGSFRELEVVQPGTVRKERKVSEGGPIPWMDLYAMDINL